MKRLSVLALLLAATGCAQVQEEFHKTYPLAATGRVSVRNVNGSVHVTAWDRNEVQVDAVKRGRSQQSLDEARIVVEPSAGAIDIRTEYPQHNRDGASVGYTLNVPRHALLDAIGTVNGSVEIDAAAGGIRASSTNGRVVVRGAEGDADLHTTNGRVEADFARLGKTVTATTVNGPIEITVPANAGANLSAKTVHGAVRSDFELPVRHIAFGPGNNVESVIGGGGADIRLSTVNGSIDLRRRQ